MGTLKTDAIDSSETLITTRSLHGVTTQKITLLTLAAEETPKLIKYGSIIWLVYV
jgi:hypothetical protein